MTRVWSLEVTRDTHLVVGLSDVAPESDPYGSVNGFPESINYVTKFRKPAR